MDYQLISNPTNIFYTCGFRGLSPDEREAWLLQTPDSTIFITDRRYESAASEVTAGFVGEDVRFFVEFLSPQNRLRDIIKRYIPLSGILGFEAENLSYAEFAQLKKALKGLSLKPIPLEQSIIKKRRTKLSNEIDSIRKACEITDRCLAEISSFIATKMAKGDKISEKDIADMICGYDGQENIAFYPIVAGQPHAAEAHYDTRQNGHVHTLQNNSYLLIDMGLKAGDYCADITRMIAVGTPPMEHQKTYQDLLKIQQMAIKKLSTIKAYKKLDMWVRKELVKKGYPEFSHALGHGVGLAVHEMPSVSMRSKDKIEPGDVITIEPGIYIQGQNGFGMRIEDTVYINEKGEPEVLTRSSY